MSGDEVDRGQSPYKVQTVRVKVYILQPSIIMSRNRM